MSSTPSAPKGPTSIPTYRSKRGWKGYFAEVSREMKKVNWTSRKELMGSTKIVVIFMLLVALFLFSVDWIFHLLFFLARVLKVPPPGIPGGHS